MAPIEKKIRLSRSETNQLRSPSPRLEAKIADADVVEDADGRVIKGGGTKKRGLPAGVRKGAR